MNPIFFWIVMEALRRGFLFPFAAPKDKTSESDQRS